MTAHLYPFVTLHTVRTATQISIDRTKSSSLRICGAGTPMPVWSCFWVAGLSRSISGLYRFCLQKIGQTAVKLPTPQYIQKKYKDVAQNINTHLLKNTAVFVVCKSFGSTILFFSYDCACSDRPDPEFINRLNAQHSDRKTLFEQTLQLLCIRHKCIKPYTPRHNGKVERSHRKDNEYFHAAHRF